MIQGGAKNALFSGRSFPGRGPSPATAIDSLAEFDAWRGGVAWHFRSGSFPLPFPQKDGLICSRLPLRLPLGAVAPRAEVAVSAAPSPRVAANGPILETLARRGTHRPGSAASSLYRVGTVSIPHLIDAMRDEETRLSALGALARFGPGARKAVPALIPLLRDELLRDGPDEVRVWAAKALFSIDSDAQRTIPVLVGALHSRSSSARLQAAAQLGKIGERARVTLPALRVAYEREKVDSVRRYIGETLEILQSEQIESRLQAP